MAQFRTSFVEDFLSFVRLKYCTVMYSTTVEEVDDLAPFRWSVGLIVSLRTVILMYDVS